MTGRAALGLSPKGTVPSLKSQRGYLLVTVVVMLFLVASIAMLLNYDSAMSANTSSGELEAARADYVAEAAMQHAMWRAGNNACMGDVTIPATTLGADSYTAAITGAAAGTAYTLAADQDAWIRNDDVTKNNGGVPDLHIRFESGNIEHALLRYDISSLPADAQINSATAWIYITPLGPGGGAHPEGPVTVHSVTADWTELGATWENMNGNFESSRLATIPVQPVDAVWVSINLTAQVQAWVNGQPNYGILMASTAEGVHGKYKSITGASIERPYLDVVVGSGPSSPVAIQATGTLDNGVTRTLSRPLTAAYQPPVIHTFSPGPAESDDAEIWDQAPNNNYGDAVETWVSSASNDTTRSLLRFSIGAIPPGARILGATLSLHRQSGSGGSVSAHRITNPWSDDSVTWNSRETGTNWDTAGGDFHNIAVATTPVGPVNQRYDWSITPLVQGWVDGSYPNYGVALIAAIDGMPGERFYTSDQAVLDVRPSLSVTYACECGSRCMAPQGSGNILMVVGDPGSLQPFDISNKTLFESWGYTVTTFDDGENQQAYDSAIAAQDVVYIARSVSSSSVGTKLTAAPIGVITEKASVVDELGIAADKNQHVGRAVDVVDTSHYITQVFPGGATPIYAAYMYLHTAINPAPGSQVLAQHAGEGTVVALDTGAQLGGGASGSAAGRRVMLPFVASDTFNPSYVNGNGHLIVQRAIAWGMNADVASVGNLLMVVGNDGNLTSQENAKKSLIESWGYAVNIIDEDDSQGDFNTSLAANDVVFVTEDVNAGDIGNKLTAATIGVVTEEANLSDELGFSAGIAWGSGTLLEVDNGYYITEPLPLGQIPVLTTNESVAYLTGTVAPDLKILGESPDGRALVELENGAALWNGGIASGRRVFLPWGGNDMDVAHLTAEGLTIFQRALEWGAGAGAAAATPTLWVSTEGDVSGSGAPGLDAWSGGEAIAFSDPNVALEPGTTDGTFASMFNLDDFASDSDADIDALHYVSTNTTVGGTSSFDLQVGDLLLSITGGDVDYTETLNGTGANQLTVKEEDVFVFRPDAPGNYSAGTFYMLLDMGPVWSNDTRAVTLVEQDTAVGDVSLPAGVFLLTQQGNYRIWRFDAANVGAGTTSGTEVILIDGGDLNFGTQPWGVELIESTATIGGVTLQAGYILVTLRHDNKTVGNTGTPATVDAEDIFYLDVTTTGTSTVAEATLLFEGLDVSLETSQEHLQALSLSTGASDPGGGTFYLDEFNAITYNGNDGTLDWSDDWQEIGESDGTGSGILRVLSDARCTSSNCIRVGHADIEDQPTKALVREADLSGATTATLSYDYEVQNVDNKGTVMVRVSGDGGSNWTTLATYTISSGSGSESFDISSYIASNTQIRVEVTGKYAMYVFIDDVRIESDGSGGGDGGGGGGGGSCDGTFRDEFNATSFSGNDGTLTWAGDWLEVGESDGATSGDTQVMNDESNYQLRTRDNNNGGEGVERDADLTGAVSATLNYDYRRQSLDNSNDYTAVEVSANGAAGPWTELTRHQGSGNDSTYQSASHDISAFISASTRVRFKTSSSMGNTDTVWFDNVEIACTP